MKRAISTILIVVVMLLSVPTIYAQDSKTMSDELRIRIEILNTLGIADIDTETIIIDEGISQKFFASMILRTMFENFEADNDELINYLVDSLNIVSTDKYKPNMLLEKDVAVEMALAALGYDIFDGYIDSPERSAKNELTKGVESRNKYITTAGAINLIYNMLKAKVVHTYAFSDGYVKVKTSQTETILSHYRHISTLEDIVIDNGVSNLYGKSTIGEDKACIGDYLVDCEKGQMREYLGKNVVAYIKNDRNGEARLLYVYEKDNDIVRIESEDIVSVSLSQIKYDDGSHRVKNIKIDGKTKVIYNGEAYADWTEEDIIPLNGYIEFINNDGKGNYDVISVVDYKTVVAKYVFPEKSTIIGEFENIEALSEIKPDLIDNHKHRILRNGTEISMIDIAVGDVLSVAQSKSGNVMDIIVSDKSFEGYIEKIDKNDRRFVIEGKEYFYTEEYEKYTKYNERYAIFPEGGVEYTFRVDFRGMIASISKAEGSEEEYGFVTGISITGTFDKEVKLKMFDQYGEWVTYALRKKVRCNGESGVTPEEVYNRLKDEIKEELIQYKLDPNNEIKEINTVVITTENGYDGFSKRPEEEMTFITQSTSFANTVFIDNNPLIWFIPENKMREDLYFVGASGDLTADAKYTVSAYNTDKSGSSKLFTIAITATNLADRSLMFAVVTSVGTKLDDNGNEVNCIICHIDKFSNETIVLGDSIDASNIKSGDVLRVYLNPAGTIENVEKLWSLEEGETINVPDVTTIRNTRALAVKGKIDSIYPEKNLVVLKKGTVTQPLRIRNDGRILVYHKNRNILTDAKLSELMPDDYAILFSRFSSVYNVVIIRD